MNKSVAGFYDKWAEKRKIVCNIQLYNIYINHLGGYITILSNNSVAGFYEKCTENEKYFAIYNCTISM